MLRTLPFLMSFVVAMMLRWFRSLKMGGDCARTSVTTAPRWSYAERMTAESAST